METHVTLLPPGRELEPGPVAVRAKRRRPDAARDRRAGFWAAAGVCVYAGFLGGVFVALGDVSRDGDLGPVLPFLAWSAANAVAATLCAAAGAALSYALWRDEVGTRA